MKMIEVKVHLARRKSLTKEDLSEILTALNLIEDVLKEEQILAKNSNYWNVHDAIRHLDSLRHRLSHLHVE